MPRSARLDAPGVLHHIMIRGIERRKIFRDNDDRNELLARLEKLLPLTGTTCYAWALLPNHAHFLFRTGKVPIATLMRRLLTGYAVYFNHRHKRTGQLFQNRYKSILCQEDAYLTELVRYIHLNPLRAGLVKSLEALHHYSYCGHGSLLCDIKRDWQDTDYVLGYFGKQRSSARKRYDHFVSEGALQGRRDDLMGGGLIRSLGGWSSIKKSHLEGRHIKSDERILGDGDFVDSLLSAAGEKVERHYAVKRAGYDLEKTAKRAAGICAVEPEDIFSGSKQKIKVQARSLFCYWASRELGISHTELARRLGVSVPAVSYAVERGGLIAKEHEYQLINIVS
ncbi:MAG: transposase [Deltaproteobacteria bacterium]|nr:transposase [Deltaproteobacteria bacterium]